MEDLDIGNAFHVLCCFYHDSQKRKPRDVEDMKEKMKMRNKLAHFMLLDGRQLKSAFALENELNSN